MAAESRHFTLTMDSLRALAGWAADCAEWALPMFEAHAPADPRPRAAIEGSRAFAAGGRRTAQLRSLALAALTAAREVGHPVAAVAARAACLAASAAYTHPLADINQAKHILGPVAYASLALELDYAGDPTIGDGDVRWAIEHVPPAVCEVLRQMPARPAGKSRLDVLLHSLDAGLRARMFLQDG